MPLYEYQCDGKCGQRFEKIQKFSDSPLAKCPNCGGKIHKLFSSPAIQFKGSGWYITDYAKKDSVSSGNTEKSEKGEKSEKAEKSETSEKSDTGSSTTETKSSSDKAEKPAEKKSSGTSPPKPSKKN